MKLSINFLKDYVDLDETIDVIKIAEDMTNAGSEYDEAGKLINATGLVIAEVIECKDHPDSDHLHCCKVNTGKEILNIVCGAPNVRKGLKVILALDGAQLPGGVIKRGVIRGEESNGMICSIAELGLESKFLKEEDKAGIHELPQDAPIGEDPIKYMQMDDSVIDFDLTANRGDLLSILGMAYEIGAIYDKKVKDIDLSHKENKEDINDIFKIKVNTDNCSIFLGKKIKNVTIKESPEFIKNRLIASGIRPINNVVDISNYVMLETGQPLHFYDADCLKGCLEVRMAKEGEKLRTLDNIERTLKAEDIVISDGEKAIGLAGVMGGYDTEITDKTKNIIIESAIFDSVKVRRTSNAILRSEASNRFEKGLDPNRTYMAIERSCNLLEKYADAEIVGGLAIYDTTEKEDKVIDITAKNINAILGMEISEKDILDVFRRLGFKSSVKNDIITVSVPRRRIDISIKEDLIEEVGRIYGVNNIKGKLPNILPKMGSYDKVSRQIRNKMIDLGLNETLSYVLVPEADSKMFTKDDYEVVKLLDPLSEDKNTLRHSLSIALYKIYEYNKARNNKDACIYELGKAFQKKGEEYSETQKIAALMSGDYYLGIDKKKVDFYVIKGVAEEILDYLGYNGRYSFIKDKEKMPDQMHPGQSAIISVNNDYVGIIGKIHPEIESEDVYILEIDLDKLLAKKVGKMKYKEISKFPSIKKDLALVVDKKLTAQEISTKIKKYAGSMLDSQEVFDVYTGKGIDEDKKSIAFSLTFAKTDRTLTDEEINEVMEKIIAGVKKDLKAELR
ncbi:MAG: phenylalanine--tRNA ligase subunit beta [Clostridia bacterium]|nr:phenylalanine--tRNA ligase subunit beta [Clostridia bacterium]